MQATKPLNSFVRKGTTPKFISDLESIFEILESEDAEDYNDEEISD